MVINQETNQYTITTVEQPRWKSWVLWTSLAALVAYVALKFFNVDIGDPLDRLLELLLPILVGFGLINDPTINGAYTNPDKTLVWYNRKSIWIAIAAFVAYVIQLVTGNNVDDTVNTIATLLISVMTAYGIVKPNPEALVEKVETIVKKGE